MAKKVVLPGDFLSTEEEFEAGKNAFVENGSIFSDSLGYAVEDLSRKTVSVEKPKNVSLARLNDVVLGEVMLVKDNTAILEIFPEQSERTRKVLLHTMASLPIRLVSRGFVKELQGLFRVGDIVRAKIAAIHPYGMDVKTNEPGLGVIKAFCCRCRKPLHLFGRSLKCLNCGSTEQRKLSLDYSLK